MTEKRTAIIVLGMHRSGTSSVAGTLALLGASAPMTLMPANDGNPKGYWESLPIQALNDRLFEAMKSNWHSWSNLDHDIKYFIEKNIYIDEISDLTKSEYGLSRFFLIKDPRLCRLMPLWSEAFIRLNIDSKFLIPYRDPLEVSYSMRDYHEFSIKKCLLLWLDNVLSSEIHSRGRVRYIFSWSEFLADWRLFIEKVDRGLDLGLPKPSITTQAQIDEFLAHDLHRKVVSEADFAMHPDVCRWVRQAYEALKDLGPRGDNAAAQAVLDQIRAEFNEAREAFGRDVLDVETIRWAAKAARLESDAQLERERSQNEAALVQITRERDHLQASLAQMRLDLAQILDQRASALQFAGQQVAERDAALAQCREDMSRFEGQFERAEAERQSAVAKINDLQNRLDALQQQWTQLKVRRMVRWFEKRFLRR